MPDMYAKLFSRITQSSLMEESIAVRYTFMMLMAIADPEGYVIGTDVALARTLNMPLGEFQAAVTRLISPDEHSNSKEQEGRRLVASDSERGYLIVNYKKYKALKTEEERRSYMRSYMRQRRGEGAGEELEGKTSPESFVSKMPPTFDQVKLLCENAGLPSIEAEKFFNFYGSNGWKVGKQPMRSLPHAVGGWAARWRERNALAAPNPTQFHIKSTKDKEVEKLLEEIERGNL